MLIWREPLSLGCSLSSLSRLSEKEDHHKVEPCGFKGWSYLLHALIDTSQLIKMLLSRDIAATLPFLIGALNLRFWESFFFSFLLWNWGLNSGFHVCIAGALSLDPQCQSILLLLFWRQGIENYFPRLALNHDPLNWCQAPK
jgi:hypothetical protein